eukprot:446379-Amphidinium_carterae.2
MGASVSSVLCALSWQSPRHSEKQTHKLRAARAALAGGPKDSSPQSAEKLIAAAKFDAVTDGNIQQFVSLDLVCGGPYKSLGSRASLLELPALLRVHYESNCKETSWGQC